MRFINVQLNLIIVQIMLLLSVNKAGINYLFLFLKKFNMFVVNQGFNKSFQIKKIILFKKLIKTLLHICNAMTFSCLVRKVTKNCFPGFLYGKHTYIRCTYRYYHAPRSGSCTRLHSDTFFHLEYQSVSIVLAVIAIIRKSVQSQTG